MFALLDSEPEKMEAYDDQGRINCKQSADDKVSGGYPGDDKLR